MTDILNLPGLLEVLGYTDDEQVQVAASYPDTGFRAEVHPAGWFTDPPPVGDGADRWFGVNPVQPVDKGRPGADSITRWAAVWADLDVKPGGCPDFDTAHAIVDDLAGLLGVRPVAVTFSGHGLQPYWAIDDQPIADEPEGDAIGRRTARAVLRQWGRLVAAVAERRNAAVDTVFDLPRILRTPGSYNHKDAEPLPVVTLADTGAPIELDHLVEVLAEYGITVADGDFDDPGAIVSPPAEWEWAERTCAYTKAAIAGWAKDTPDARHPWLVAQATRLACLHRAGCITADDHRAAVDTLAGRFRALLAIGQVRKENPGEIADALAWGQQRAAAMSDTSLDHELGNRQGRHGHDDKVLAQQIVDNIKARENMPENMPPAGRPRLTVVPPVDGTAALQPQPAPPSVRRHTDDGNAHALIAAYGDAIRYDTARGRWLTWTGYRWQVQPPGGGAVRELPKDVARRYIDDNPGDDTARKWGMKSLAAPAIANTLAMAASDPRITVTTDQLDADPWILNTPGGLVDLRTGTLRPATPDDLVTRTTNAIPNLGEQPLLWTGFLHTTFGGDTALIGYMQRLAGLALIGEVREQILPFWFGTGANGKSTLLEALMWALRTGEDGYAKAAPAEILMVRRHEGHPTELADLAGARLVVCTELEDGQRLAEARVKLLTGRDTISARFLYGQPFTYTPSHLIVLAGNHKPQATVGGPALWRRIRAVPFGHTVPEDLRDPDLPDKLQQVAGHILAWAIRGAADYLEGGMRTPPAVLEATREYEADQDTVGRFVADRVGQGPRCQVAVRELRSTYEKWCADNGDTAVSARRLTEELAARFGIKSVKGNRGERFYAGAFLYADENDEDNDQITEADRPW